jgi:YbbR domain-containing protein
VSELTRNWPLKLLALAIALTLWIAVTTRDPRWARAEATLRVVPVVRGTPALGHRVTAVRVEPNVVVVRGRRSTIGRRDSIQTTPVDVAGRRSSVTQSVGLAFPDSVSALADGGGSVQVTVDIQASGTALDTEGLRR